MISRFLPALALAIAAVFFGVAAYINLAEQPARLALTDAPLLQQWKTSFAVGIVLQGTLTVVAGLMGLATWWFHRDWRWLVGGILMLVNWPWTLLFIAPINNALLSITADAAGPASRTLIEQWGMMHSGRTAISFIAVILYLWAVARRQSSA
jgi:hypothetical protein